MGKNVAIIYSDGDLQREKTPFEDEYLNNHYAAYNKFEDIEIVLASPEWYQNGKLTKAWAYDNGWDLIDQEINLDGAFDKFRDIREFKEKINSQVGLMNEPELTSFCQDKLKTYERFPSKVAETLKATTENVSRILEQDGKAVLKPRYDYGGEGVKIIENMDEYEGREDLLVQRFVESGNPPRSDIEEPHDFRVIFIQDDMAQAYIRRPEEGLIANVSKGGTMEFVDIENISQIIKEASKPVREELSSYSPKIYSIDFMFDKNQEPWIVELNSKPAICNLEKEVNEEYEEPAISKLVEAFRKI